ncbi:MAG TPA: SUMF1/EgtB/PvdO family nonheme iron enzyme [Polyangiaceae bacterium]|jgi:formylglycine-generating enzyme required for sulfatase activity|nr:SUMF1/EgtB/PvdO family nonheme iron enzyme [Polyangiaceae bacterium]
MSNLEQVRRGLSSLASLGLLLWVSGCLSAKADNASTGGAEGVVHPVASGGRAAVAQGGAGGGGNGGGAGAPFACESTAETNTMVAVAAGDFMMGCNAAIDSTCNPNEQPGHAVTVGAFEIDVTEVTQDSYTTCVNAGVCAAPSCEWDCAATGLPASCLDKSQAKAYCGWADKRLPTEAEWEKAARGSDGRIYPWGNNEPDCQLTNMAGCADQPEPVGSHPSGVSPYGVLDMAGNMVEMVADSYDAEYYATAPIVDPQGPVDGDRYVGRGGGFKSTAEWQRTSVRDWYDLADTSSTLGFRCAR